MQSSIKLALALLLFSTASAQEAFFKLPDSLVTRQGGAVTLQASTGNLTYIEGIGWQVPRALTPPLTVGESVYGTAELVDLLGVTTPRLESVRFGGSGTVRIVLDLASLAALPPGLERQGRLEQDDSLELPLPDLLLPLDLPDPYRGIELDIEDGPTTTLKLTGGEASYHVFGLNDPTRIVIDITPSSYAEVEEETTLLRPGVVYRRFAAVTGIGSSGVHVLEMAPSAGEFRVVGESETPGTVSQLSSGAFAGINAGYFDTRSFDAIGLLKIDFGLLSLPSRNRASIGFGAGGAVIDRVGAEVRVRINGLLYDRGVFGQDFEVYTAAGQQVGGPTKGVLTVGAGRVVDNKVGPRTVPQGGFAVVYTPTRRDLALIDSGASASLEVEFLPAVFGGMRYAVEAGPLLVANGLPAYAPASEQFRRGERILDDYTQQAAIGVRPDGTVLFVVADNMIAEELVPLMLSLGSDEAMRLDSGGSTTLVIDGEVVNRTAERRVVSAIVFVPYAN